MALVRFDLITGSHGEERCLARIRMDAVPLPGETISVNGDPYVVKSRGWAVDTDEVTYAYLKVTKLFDFKVSP